MTPNSHWNVNHLTDEQIDDILIDCGEDSAVDHLAKCPDCGQRLAAFQSSLALFNQASLDWSAARSNTMSRDMAGHRSQRGFTPAALGACAAGLLVFVAAGVGSHRQHDAATINPARSSAVEMSGSAGGVQDRQHEIASDNAMLQAIDLEIVRPESAAFSTMDLEHNLEAHNVSCPQVRN